MRAEYFNEFLMRVANSRTGIRRKILAVKKLLIAIDDKNNEDYNYSDLLLEIHDDGMCDCDPIILEKNVFAGFWCWKCNKFKNIIFKKNEK